MDGNVNAGSKASGEPARQDRLQPMRGGTPTVAIALGGGGARGIAHIALLEAIDELGLRVTAVAGTFDGRHRRRRLCGGPFGCRSARPYARNISRPHQCDGPALEGPRRPFRRSFRRTRRQSGPRRRRDRPRSFLAGGGAGPLRGPRFAVLGRRDQLSGALRGDVQQRSAGSRGRRFDGHSRPRQADRNEWPDLRRWRRRQSAAL